MENSPKIAFIGAGSTVFMKNIVGDILRRPALAGCEIRLMDIDEGRLEESWMVGQKLIRSMKAPASASRFTDQRRALEGADFVIVAFQIGGYEPCTVTDFRIPERYGVRQTIGDTLGIGGIMRGLRTVPHLWRLCEDMADVCPGAILLQYVNPMAINTWAISARFPEIRQVGLCHSVQGTVAELARDLGLPKEEIRYMSAGINHMAFFLRLERRLPGGKWRDLYPDLRKAYAEGRAPLENLENPRCPNLVRYEVMRHLGYFATESSEHFAEYVPWFIKPGRDDLIERLQIPLGEYPKRCEEQIAAWREQAEAIRAADTLESEESREYAAQVINSAWTGEPAVVYGNVPNHGLIANLPEGCAVEVPCLVDACGIHPTRIGDLPPQLAALMRTNTGPQELTVRALLEGRIDHVYHAAMLDPLTAAALDLDQIRSMVDELVAAHGDWLPPLR